VNLSEIMAHNVASDHVLSVFVRRQPVPGNRFGPQAEATVADVARRRGVTVKELRSDERNRRVAHARQEAMYELYATGLYSLPTIGTWFGGRDHTTVLHAVRAHEARLRAESEKAAA
jgi:chromosomal replication initiator protein